MAVTPTVLYRGAAATTSTTLYTTPASTTAIVSNIVIANTSGSAQTFTLSLNGIVIASATAIAANSTTFIDLKQVLPTTQILAGFASATTVNFSVSGVQVV